MEMELTEFVFRLLLIFTPGLVAFFIIKQLTIHKKYEFYEECVYSFMLGLISYLVYFATTKILTWLNVITLSCDLIKNLTDKTTNLNFREIFFVSIISVFLGLFFSIVITRSWFHRFAQWARISNKFGALSVFDHIMNSKMPPWVVIRDLKSDLMFEGWIEAFPDTTEENGIFLRDAIVYKNSTGKKLYETSGLFVERDRKDLIYDFPILGLDEKETKNKKENENGKRSAKK